MSSFGKLILIIGPSGSGKGTMISLLKERKKDYFYPISATTREPREGEKNGETYHFLTNKEFEEGIEKGDFLEYALVHGKAYYGTLKKPILNAINSGKIVIREIDVQGFASISETFPKEKLSSIFIKPPSEEILRKRIKERAPISEDELDARIFTMKKEMLYIDKTDEILGQGNIEEMYLEFLEKIDNIFK